MPVLVAHLRWNALTTEQQQLVGALLEQEGSRAGCCSCTARSEGSSLLATAVWDCEASMLTFTAGPLARTTTTAGLPEPQVALFAVPEPFAAAYRRLRQVPVPAPRAPSVRVEQPVG